MSSSRKESERAKFVQEKCQTLLTLMLRDEDNKYCVDCDAKGPRWASWNLGVFLCIRCAGIHRNLGVHISRVKSVNLDSWTPEQVVSLQQMGNSRARAVYEAQLPDGFRRPQTDSALESFIRAKYEHKKYVAREWVQPPPVKANWDKEIEEEMEKQKRKKKGLGIASTTSSNSKPTDSKKSSISLKSTPIPAPLPKPTNNSSSPKTSSRISNTTTVATDNTTTESNSFSSDLLGLSTPINASSANESRKLSADSNDVFSYFLSGPINTNASQATSEKNGKSSSPSVVPASVNNHVKSNHNTSLAQEEQDFFNQIPTEKEKAKLTKDSILALYGTAPTIGQFNQTTNNHQFVSQMMQPLNNTSASAGYMGSGNNAIAAGAQYQSSYGMPSQSGVGFQMPLQQQQQSSHQPTQAGGFTSFTHQPVGFPTAAMQQFAQHPNPNLSLPPTTANSANTINQQFGNLNLGNVWQ